MSWPVPVIVGATFPGAWPPKGAYESEQSGGAPQALPGTGSSSVIAFMRALPGELGLSSPAVEPLPTPATAVLLLDQVDAAVKSYLDPVENCAWAES